MPTIPEIKTKHYEKYFKHLPAILKVKVKYILFQCSANRNFKPKKIRIRFYNVQFLLSSISIKNIHFCTKKRKQEMNFTLASPAPSVPPLLFLFVTDCDNSITSVDNPSPWHGWLQFLFWKTKV